MLENLPADDEIEPTGELGDAIGDAGYDRIVIGASGSQVDFSLRDIEADVLTPLGAISCGYDWPPTGPHVQNPGARDKTWGDAFAPRE
jgi:hypothetical protein